MTQTHDHPLSDPQRTAPLTVADLTNAMLHHRQTCAPGSECQAWQDFVAYCWEEYCHGPRDPELEHIVAPKSACVRWLAIADGSDCETAERARAIDKAIEDAAGFYEAGDDLLYSASDGRLFAVDAWDWIGVGDCWKMWHRLVDCSIRVKPCDVTDEMREQQRLIEGIVLDESKDGNAARS